MVTRLVSYLSGHSHLYSPCAQLFLYLFNSIGFIVNDRGDKGRIGLTFSEYIIYDQYYLYPQML